MTGAMLQSAATPKAPLAPAQSNLQGGLPPQLAARLSGLTLTGFPAEAPWQEERPSWAVDATKEELQQLLYFLAWFYGLGDPLDPPLAPLDPKHCFVAVGPTIRIKVGNTTVHFDFYPSSQARYSDLLSLAHALCTWRRQPASIKVESASGKPVYVEVMLWTRPEFITLAIMRGDGSTRRGGDLRPGKRGNDEQGGRFGVIPCDLDYSEGDHAPSTNGLRRPTEDEAPGVLSLSSLPWGYKMVGGGGEYNYLKLAEPMSFEDDPIRAKEIIQGAQRELCDAAAKEGVDVDLAFKGATSLCRVPFSTPTKYLWKRGRRIVLACPDLGSGKVAITQELEQYRDRSRTSHTRRKVAAHKARLKRDGTGTPRALSECFEVRIKDLPYGRIYVIRCCPICGNDGHKAHIAEMDWKLKCKRASCKAVDGMPHGAWLKTLPDGVRSALRRHILADVALSRLVEYQPLEFDKESAHIVRGFHDGKDVVQAELQRSYHLAVNARGGGRQPSRITFLNADCGAGKTYGASEASRQIPLLYSAPQYSLLDSFRGHSPYQIQGIKKGCLFEGVGEIASERGVGRCYLCG